MQSLRRHARAVRLIAIACVLVLVATLGIVGSIRHPAKTHLTAQDPTATSIPATPTAVPLPAVPLPDGNDWAQYRYDVSGTGANPETRISSANIAQLSQSWVYAYGSDYAASAIVNGVVYTNSDQTLHAIDLRSGQVKWTFQVPHESFGTYSGIAVDSETRHVYYGTSSAQLFAVNMDTGKQAWVDQLGDPKTNAWIWDAPLVVNGHVYVGVASRDDTPCVRGDVFALDPNTGAIFWTHYFAPAGALGGGVWSSLSADLAAHEIIASTGNPCPEGPVQSEEDSIVGLDWDTGTTHWLYQALTYDTCDCDFGEGAAIFTLQGLEYIVAGNKNGTVYALTRSAPGDKPHLAWSKSVTGVGAYTTGGIFEPPTYTNGLVFVGGGPTPDGACPRGALTAFNAQTGAVLWRNCTSSQLVAASAATGDVLFVAMADRLVAYNINTGQQLWAAQQPGQAWGGVAISRGFVVSVTVAGKIYCYALPYTSRSQR